MRHAIRVARLPIRRGDRNATHGAYNGIKTRGATAVIASAAAISTIMAAAAAAMA